MDITPQDDAQNQSISDDQELAQALSSVMPDVPEALIPAPQASAAQFNDDEFAPAVTLPPLSDTPAPEPAISVASVAPEPTVATPLSGELEGIKKNALEQLRPLIGKVDLPAEEKFDVYLMLIRSTDDASLVGPASDAAKDISDEKRRAEAFLDIIKEIDYLSRNQTA